MLTETLHFTRECAPDFFPSSLWEVKRPPTSLYIQGRPTAFQLLERLPHRGLAIVGSRSCQMRSRQIIEAVLTPMKNFDWIIVSGLARGVDAWAHEQALRLGFPTIAILGCGLGVQYPAENQLLRQRILEAGGLVITELPPEHEAVPWAFIHRNRLIAGWSRAVWVVQAGFRSGALNTASWAVANERPLFATPTYPGDPGMVGNQRLLSDETAHCVWSSRSFGRVWLEIESFLAETRALHNATDHQLLTTGTLSREQLLSRETTRRITETGGVRTADLLGWALEKGWSSEQFFETLSRVSGHSPYKT